jgi:predicted membrane-bound spermidine synthase
LCVGAGKWWWIFCHKTDYNITTLNQTQTKIVEFLFQEVDININWLCKYTINQPNKDLTTLQHANHVRHILRLQAQIKDDFSSKVNYTAFLE